MLIIINYEYVILLPRLHVFKIRPVGVPLHHRMPLNFFRIIKINFKKFTPRLWQETNNVIYLLRYFINVVFRNLQVVCEKYFPDVNQTLKFDGISVECTMYTSTNLYEERKIIVTKVSFAEIVGRPYKRGWQSKLFFSSITYLRGTRKLAPRNTKWHQKKKCIKLEKLAFQNNTKWLLIFGCHFV